MVKPLFAGVLATFVVGCSTLEPPPVTHPVQQTVYNGLTYQDILNDFLFAYDECSGDIPHLYRIMEELPPTIQLSLLEEAKRLAGEEDVYRQTLIDTYIDTTQRAIVNDSSLNKNTI